MWQAHVMILHERSVRHLGRLGQFLSAHEQLHRLDHKAVLRVVSVGRPDHKRVRRGQ